MKCQGLVSFDNSENTAKTRVAALWLCVIAAVLLACSAVCLAPGQAMADEQLTAGTIAAQADGDTVSLGVTANYNQTEARKMLDMVNDFRTGNDAWEWNESNTQQVWHSNLSKLKYDYGLECVAMQRAAEISLKMSHERPDGKTDVTALLDDYNSCFENLTTAGKTAEQAFDAWLETNEYYDGQGHRRNMLESRATHIGIAYAECNGVNCWVQVIGSPAVDTSYVAPENSKKTVSVEVAKSLIASELVAPSASPTSLSVSEEMDADLPTVTATLMILSSSGRLRVPVTVENLKWTSADSRVATIQGGKVLGKKVGSTTISATATLRNDTKITVPVEVTENGLKDAVVNLSPSSFTYDGTEKQPNVTVTLNGETLKSPANYSVEYADNVNAGTATVVVTGKGKYAGVAKATFKIAKAQSSISLANASATYTGKAIAYPGKVTKSGSTGKVTYAYFSDKACTKSVKAALVKNAGTYYVKATLAADANYEKATSAAAKFVINKKANTFKVAPVKKTQTAYAKKSTTLSAKKVFKVTKNASGGKVTYKKTSGASKIKVAKTGKVTIAKGLKAGNTYTVKVKATAAATANYKSKSSVVTFKVKVK